MCPISYKDFLADRRDYHALPDQHEQQQAEPSETNSPSDNARCVTDEMRSDKSALATKLERVTEKAVDKTDEILGLALPDHASFGAVLRAQNAAANTVLNTQVKVDENRLRKQQIDRLPELLEIIREE